MTRRFTQKKFQSLELKQQHKKCAELLKEAIECEATPRLERLSHYLELCSWMGFETLHSFHLEDLADRFHAHMELCGIGVREDRMFNIRSQDTPLARGLSLPVTIYLQDIRSAHNVGSIIRSAECMGLARVVTSNKTASLDHLQVKRSSMGCEKWIEVVQHQNLSVCPRPWIAIETVEGAPSIWEFDFPLKGCTLIVGNEEYGIREELLSYCDAIIQIPVFGRKNSLNVASALSCVAYEMRRQYEFKNLQINT